MKITKLLLLSLAVIFLSCSKDEDPKLPTSEGMVGTWKITALEYKGTTTTTIESQSIKADFTGVGKDMNLTSTFALNPNTITNEGSYTIVLTTTYMGQTITEEYPYEEVVTDGTWALDGKTLTVTNNGVSQSATIIEQTATTIKVLIEVDQTETDPDFTINIKAKGTYTFTKQ